MQPRGFVPMMRSDLERQAYTKPLLTIWQRRGLWLLILCWALASAHFWHWWLRPETVNAADGWIGWAKFGLISVLLGWVWFLQGFFLVSTAE
jgi:hypothetical protein